MARRDVTLRRIGPLSAFRLGMAFSLVGLAAWLLAVALLWFGLDALGVVAQVNNLITDVGGHLTITFGLVLAAAAIIGVAIAVLTMMVCPLLAVIYNAVVDLFGGLSLRLADH